MKNLCVGWDEPQPVAEWQGGGGGGGGGGRQSTFFWKEKIYDCLHIESKFICMRTIIHALYMQYV